MRARQALSIAAVFAAGLAGCTSVGIGIGLPIGRMGGVSVGGTIPIPPREPAASAPGTPASGPGAPGAAASSPASVPASAPAGR